MTTPENNKMLMRPAIQNLNLNKIESFTKSYLFPSTLATNKNTSIIEILMPEIAESIDEFPEGIENVNVAVEEKVERPNINSNTNYMSKLPTTQHKESERNEINKRPSAVLRRYFNGEHTETIKNNRIVSITTIKTSTTYPTTKKITTTEMIKTTKKNFRKFNDYYAMYYDV